MENEKKKLREDKLFLYANSLYALSIGKGEEFTALNGYISLRDKLEKEGWLINITPEVGKSWVNWSWQIIVPDNEDYNTGMYGDNGEYKSSFKALEFSVIRALELYVLYKTDIDQDLLNRIINKYKITKPLDNIKNVLDLILFIEGRLIFLEPVDKECFNYVRTSGKEYIEYINKRIRECLDV